MALRIVSRKWWTPRELEQRKLLPFERQTEEGRSLRPPPAAFGTTTTNTKEGVK